MNKPKDQVNTYKAILSRVDNKPWKPIIRLEDGWSINNSICEYIGRQNNSTYECRVFQYATFPHNGSGWDGRAVTFPMPHEWDWLGKKVTLAIGTVTHSVCF
jgi:hypothetical protein